MVRATEDCEWQRSRYKEASLSRDKAEAEAKDLMDQLTEAKQRRTTILEKATSFEAEMQAQLADLQQKLAVSNREKVAALELRCEGRL